jgi:hypothetical protein
VNVLFNRSMQTCEMHVIRSRGHELTVDRIRKSGLSAFDDKRYLLDDIYIGISSYAYFYYKSTVNVLNVYISFLLMFGCAAYFVLMFGLLQYVMYVKTHTWMNLRPRSVCTDGDNKVSLFLSMTLLFMSSTNIWGKRQQQEEYIL